MMASIFCTLALPERVLCDVSQVVDIHNVFVTMGDGRGRRESLYKLPFLPFHVGVLCLLC